MFDIPVVLFIFRRVDTMPKIISRLAEIQPSKVYLLADAGRNESEKQESDHCRQVVESLITWPCTIVRNYADDNRGVYKNIGDGAKWIFQQEEKAIFIEDDNLPEISFFYYAQELLEKYENDPKVLWICGTNYYSEMDSEYSYHFTKHLLPCGWASWRDKFTTYYDGELKEFKSIKKRIQFLWSYHFKLLGWVQLQSIKNEYYRFRHMGKFLSWDYQMVWSVRSNDMYGVIPMKNQITNIGVDNFSIHGGNTKSSIMTDRFCEVPSLMLELPLAHPPKLEIDSKCESAIGKVICPPVKSAIRIIIGSKLKHLMGHDSTASWKQIIHRKG